MKQMTVAELIEQLKNYPPDAEVRILMPNYDDEGAYISPEWIAFDLVDDQLLLIGTATEELQFDDDAE